MLIDDTDFNQAWAMTKTEAQFIAEFEDVDHIFPGPNKLQKLKEAYKLLTTNHDTIADIA